MNIEALNRNPYYGPLYRETVAHSDVSTALLKVTRAGYIEETFDSQQTESLYLVTAPWDRLIPQREETNSNAILVLTGSFDPIHHGHVNMMNNARKAVENLGHHVVAGVFSTSHDAYVRGRKTREGIDAHQRGIDNSIFIDSHPLNYGQWMIHDIWESQVNPDAVNFTTVLDHIRQAVQSRSTKEYRFFFLFGADNSEFASAFQYHENVMPVCLQRGDYPVSTVTTHLIHEGKCLFVENDVTSSSTQIRAEVYRPYVVRQDAKLSTEHLADCMPDYDARIASFRAGFNRTLKLMLPTSIHYLDVQDQLTQTRDYLNAYYPHTRVLSADAYFTHSHATAVRVSRLFDLAGAQVRADQLTELSFPDGVADPSYEYVLVDHDIIANGSVQEIEKKYQLSGKIDMLKLVFPYDVHTVVSERDFILGAKEGGLMMGTTTTPIKYPLIAPYANVNTRAGVPTERAHEFSRILWELNYKLYKGTDLYATQVGAEFVQEVAKRDVLMEELCQSMWHAYGGNRFSLT